MASAVKTLSVLARLGRRLKMAPEGCHDGHAASLGISTGPMSDLGKGLARTRATGDPL